MHILLIELNTANMPDLAQTISGIGHDVSTVPGASQAMDLLATDVRIDLVMGNHAVFTGDGGRLIEKIHEVRRTRYVYLIALASTAAPESGADNWEFADHRIILPLDAEALQSHLDLGLRINTLENELNQKYSTIKRHYYQTISALIQLMDSYDEALGAHCRRVGDLALRLAKRHPNVKVTDYPVIEAAGNLHDIGFVGLPKALFSKGRAEMPGNEFQQYRSHSIRGEEILTQVDLLKPVARIVRQHHEQFNARGFPDAVAGKKISVAAQIISAASLYDSMMNVKKEALPKVAEDIQLLRGYQLSPQMVDILLEVHLAEMEIEAAHQDKKISLEDLTTGMVLSRDVRMKSGAFCMPGGKRLDEIAIAKLKQYYQLGNINEDVFISK